MALRTLALSCFAASALPVLAGGALVRGLDEPYRGAPIHYESKERTDPVAALARAVADGQRSLEWDSEKGWLPALLEALDVPVESQLLVFSKTSLQRDRISPETPRAIYFSGDVAFGWIPGSPTMEIVAQDPGYGPTFYAVAQRSKEFALERRDGSCLSCHASSRTRGWPGHLVRSVHPDERGEPILREGTYRTTHESPLAERWGGWYVTGDVGGAGHLGNAVVEGGEGRLSPAPTPADLSEHFDVRRYPSEHSDVVALLVYDHQAAVHNALAFAAYDTRVALDYQRVLNEALGDPPGHVGPSTERRIRAAAEDVVDHLLLRDAASFVAPIRGDSGFRAAYESRGARDARGRSLSDLDLETRLYRYSCSPLIDSPAFDALPEAVRNAVWADLGAILLAEEGAREMPHLAEGDRRAILEILRETHGNIPQELR